MTNELRSNRAKLIEDMRSLNNKAEAENRDLTSEEKVNYDKMNADAIVLKNRYERLENQDALAKELTQSRGSIVDPIKGFTTSEPTDKLNTREYKDAMNTYIRTGETHKLRALDVGTGSQGGYTLPTDVVNQMVLALNRGSVMRKAGASVLATGSNTNIPISSTVSGTWVAEASAFGNGSDTDPSLTVFNALAYKYTVGTKISNELLDDSSIDIASYITERFNDSIAQATDNGYVAGAGSGSTQPTGLLTGATTKAVLSEETFTANELLAHYFSVPAQYRSDPSFAWIMNDVTLGNIAAMATLTTNSSIVRIPFNYSMVPGTPDTLFGRPVYSSAAMPVTYDANAKILVCGAMKYYQIVDRLKQAGIVRLNELFAATYQTGFIGSWRTDGKCLLPDAFRTMVLAAS